MDKNRGDDPVSSTKETFAYSNYTITERVQSKFDSDVVHTNVVGFKCPRCKSACCDLNHAEALTCESCGLHMCLYGNGLTCTASSMDTLINEKRGKMAPPLTVLNRVMRLMS